MAIKKVVIKKEDHGKTNNFKRSIKLSKKIFVLLLGCFLITSFALSAVVTVNTTTLGSNEFFGVKKTIVVSGGIDLKIGVAYLQNDLLEWTLPPGFLFKNPGYYIARTNDNGVTWTTDSYPIPGGDGLADFTYFSGGLDNNFILFRVSPNAIGVTGVAPENVVVNASRWRLVNVAIPAPIPMPAGADDILIEVPLQSVQGTPAAWTSGSSFGVTTQAIFGAIRYDASSTAAPVTNNFFTIYDEYRVVLGGFLPDSSERAIEFASPSLRTQFVALAGATNVESLQPFKLERNALLVSGFVDPVAGPYRNPVTLFQLVAADIFEVKSAKTGANYTGLASPGVYLGAPVWSVPPDAAGRSYGPPTIFSIPGNTVFGILNFNNFVRYVVTGTTVLDDRTFDFAFEFKPANTVAARKFNGYKYADWRDAWKWAGNGAQFRSQFAVAATDSGYNSALRIGNFGPFNAPVYADIWMDDGQKVSNVLLTDGPGDTGILPNSYRSWIFSVILDKAVAQNPGFTYVKTWPSQSTKGRFRVVVQGAFNDIGAYLQYVTPIGITSIIMEKFIGGNWIW